MRGAESSARRQRATAEWILAASVDATALFLLVGLAWLAIRRCVRRLRPPTGHDAPVLWSFAHIRVEPAAEDDGRQPRLSCEATVDREGNFHLDDLPPDDYWLSVHFYREPAGGLIDYRFSVPKAKNDIEEPVDLGDLTLANE